MKYCNDNLKNVVFPLGGIGTGCIGLSGNGELRDFEIFNRPNKNSRNGYTHFAIKAECDGRSAVRVLHGDTTENLSGEYKNTPGFCGYGFGVPSESMAGFPHFRDVCFDGRFPLADITFSEPDFPAEIRLTAYNPMIPQNEYDSSLPVAVFEWEIANNTDTETRYTLAFTVKNPNSKSVNRTIENGNFKGVYMTHGELTREDVGYSDLTVITDASDASVEEYWYRGGWQDGVTTYWKNLTELERLPERKYDTCGGEDHSTVAAYVTLAPSESRRVRFVLSWSTPVQYNYWMPYRDEDGRDITWKNHYATRFATSAESATYTLENCDRLKGESETFARAMNESTLPEVAIDALTANLAVLKSATVLRYEDGSFWAWEGVCEKDGSCEGSCQHVWNYAYALPFLFPDLERTMRENNIKYALFPDGRTAFRIRLPLGRKCHDFRACVDGQMGEVIKCYREWKISGDTEWLKRHADAIFLMLDYAFSEENPDAWDRNRDGVLEGRQHHTLDMELYGPSSWLEGFYLLALDCGAKIAEAIGDAERAVEYRRIYKNGREWVNENLWGGEYFIQRVDLTDLEMLAKYGGESYWNDETGEIKYQIGEGCIIDQMLADWHAHLIGLGGIFDKNKKDTALETLYRNNFKPSMREVTNMWRNFALNNEAGTVICTYPEGARVPAIPIPYCEECMTGFEYALAGLMIAEGKEAHGIEMIGAVRERYNGKNRNPYNEIECGSNYARSMASFALLNIYSGFEFDMTRGYLGFYPLVGGKSQFLFSIADSWGTVNFGDGEVVLKILGKPLALSEIGVKVGGVLNFVTVDGERCDFTTEGDHIKFAAYHSVKDTLVIKYS